MKAIAIKDLSFAYRKEDVIKSCNLEVESGELVLIIGGNGSGKSTLVKLMLGELEPDKGSIKILGKDIAKYKSYKKIGYVPQSQKENLYTFPISVKELVTLQLYESMGMIKIPRKIHYDKTMELLKKMNLEKYADYPLRDLSGGLRQRVVITRALMNNPEILIFDEPTSGVDEASKRHFAKSLEDLNKNFDVSIIYKWINFTN